ncbi:MAG: tyrosine-type recombinase/integrase [Rikenellaceae bacterium]
MKDKFIEYLKYERGYSLHTIRAYSDDLALWCQFTSPTSYTDCTLSDARAFVMQQVEEGQNPRSINRRISSLRTFYTFLMREGALSSNPFTKIHLQKQPLQLPNFVQSSQMGALLERQEHDVRSATENLLWEASDSYSVARDATIVMLLYHTGLRRSEVCGLRLSDFDTTQRTLNVIGKRLKQRIVPLNSAIFEVLLKYLQKRDEFCCLSPLNFLFLKEKRGSEGELVEVVGNDIYRIVRREMTGNVSGARCSPHTLRHTFATDLMRNGVGINQVQELLGHSSISSTQIYTHNTIAELKKAYNAAHPRVGSDRENQEDEKLP